MALTMLGSFLCLGSRHANPAPRDRLCGLDRRGSRGSVRGRDCGARGATDVGKAGSGWPDPLEAVLRQGDI